MTGPLQGLRVIEMAGTAPVAFAATMLADLGAEVTRVDRAPGRPPAEAERDNPFGRSRNSTVVDLKSAEGPGQVLDLLAGADVFLEGFRPGVCERLGIGPEAALARNPGLVYVRVTGWGQQGELSGWSGHDITLLALAGALADGDREPLRPPPYYVASFAGGSMMAVTALLAALWERDRSGLGQVVDLAMADGAAYLSGMVQRWRETGVQALVEAPFYRTYACADGRHVAVAAIEPKLYAALLDVLGLDPAALPDRDDERSWPELTRAFADAFAGRSQQAWTKAVEGVDAGLAPVLALDEAAAQPHLSVRGTFVEVGSTVQPAPVPRFSRTATSTPTPAPLPGELPGGSGG